jgi:hypothetical protein
MYGMKNRNRHLCNPKSKSTELLINPSKPATSEFGQVSSTEWRLVGKIMTISEIIEDEAQVRRNE